MLNQPAAVPFSVRAARVWIWDASALASDSDRDYGAGRSDEWSAFEAATSMTMTT